MEKIIAIMYDVDFTLTPKLTQEYGLFKNLKSSFEDFKIVSGEIANKYNEMDRDLCYLLYIIEIAKKNSVYLTKNLLYESGKNIQFFPGVLTWFDRINNYAQKYNIQVKHFIISSGSREILEGMPIAKYFTKIFASFYAYNDKNEPIWPSQIVNYTNKTQCIYRVRKNTLDDLASSKRVNSYMEEEQKIPYKSMIYIGDGDTDIPCMQIVKDKGGKSICVFNPKDEKSVATSNELLEHGRVNVKLSADYSENSEMENYIKDFISSRYN